MELPLSCISCSHESRMELKHMFSDQGRIWQSAYCPDILRSSGRLFHLSASDAFTSNPNEVVPFSLVMSGSAVAHGCICRSNVEFPAQSMVPVVVKVCGTSKFIQKSNEKNMQHICMKWGWIIYSRTYHRKSHIFHVPGCQFHIRKQSKETPSLLLCGTWDGAVVAGKPHKCQQGLHHMPCTTTWLPGTSYYHLSYHWRSQTISQCYTSENQGCAGRELDTEELFCCKEWRSKNMMLCCWGWRSSWHSLRLLVLQVENCLAMAGLGHLMLVTREFHWLEGQQMRFVAPKLGNVCAFQQLYQQSFVGCFTVDDDLSRWAPSTDGSPGLRHIGFLHQTRDEISSPFGIRMSQWSIANHEIHRKSGTVLCDYRIHVPILS